VAGKKISGAGRGGNEPFLRFLSVFFRPDPIHVGEEILAVVPLGAFCLADAYIYARGIPLFVTDNEFGHFEPPVCFSIKYMLY
jgi:hypothetical protein